MLNLYSNKATIFVLTVKEKKKHKTRENPHGFEIQSETITISLPTLRANIDTRLIASDIDSDIGAVVQNP